MSTETHLRGLRDLIANAKGVPMSTSCMIGRSEALSMVDAALADLPQDLERAQTIIGSGEAEVERGREQAEQIIAEARQQAEQLVSETEIMQAARAQAEELGRTARQEADGFQQEADTFVDQRMAGLEADLQRTLSQIGQIRSQLSQRAGLDEDRVEPIPGWRSDEEDSDED
ncbi:ATP synthase subunit B family protein [Parenemella sanctibonifatiensis]|uniref:ATP synthase F0 subunit B n=1 Tax=Parenemella sanctibonifatiensis TaxID=2016505 RepID=A0A255EJG1_9ACTN|nr:hypothetical protein [Parenemella sanctibonifatiensis]OYN88204.1 hypothetical protein CGZ92_04460 [Parenemella sanctibonifatiensis]OYN91370.1 hypothetical protein CGZ91_08055 [Parenemella sanctibonifatiensis]